MTKIYFAGSESSSALESLKDWAWEEKPIALLTSFAYINGWKKVRESYRPSAVILDSGAFTAYTRGTTIDIDALIAEFMTGAYDEGVGLDVIGDWKGSRDNLDYMRERGAIGMMPVFHIGDPWHLLEYYCRHWPKVGLSCRFGEPRAESIRFYEQCFARAWPHRFHSFGWIEESMLMAFPFHSADASTWLAAAVQYHNMPVKKRGVAKQVHLDGPIKNAVSVPAARVWVEHFRAVERRLAARWRRQLVDLERNA